MGEQNSLVDSWSRLSIIIIPGLTDSSHHSHFTRICHRVWESPLTQTLSKLSVLMLVHASNIITRTTTLTFHMIKIPSSTNKVKKRKRERSAEERGAIFGCVPISSGMEQYVGRYSQKSSKLRRGYVSAAVSSPLLTCFLPCLCEPFHPDPAERQGER